MLDYYYGPEAEQFAFYRIPKILFEAENVSLSTDAKLLYGIFLDRMQLSAKNKWLDDNGRVYIFFTVKQIMKAMQISNKTATKLLHELEKTGFIEAVKIDDFAVKSKDKIDDFAVKSKNEIDDFAEIR